MNTNRVSGRTVFQPVPQDTVENGRSPAAVSDRKTKAHRRSTRIVLNDQTIVLLKNDVKTTLCRRIPQRPDDYRYLEKRRSILYIVLQHRCRVKETVVRTSDMEKRRKNYL